MPKKTLALISGLVLVTVILFILALRSTNTNSVPLPMPTPTLQAQSQVSPTAPAHSILSLSPNPITVAPGQKGSVDVNIDTADNAVTAIQLEIAYDPNIITNVKVTPGTLLPNPPDLLFDINNAKTGRYTYAYGIGLKGTQIQGPGSVAKITFTALNKPGQTSQLALLPTSIVSARGENETVLKSATGTLVVIGQAGPSVRTSIPQ